MTHDQHNLRSENALEPKSLIVHMVKFSVNKCLFSIYRRSLQSQRSVIASKFSSTFRNNKVRKKLLCDINKKKKSLIHEEEATLELCYASSRTIPPHY